MTRAPTPRLDLEQSCSRCGRFEAAGSYCSWCGLAMTEADWYPTTEAADRRVVPATRPDDPPMEFLKSQRDWPPQWGPFPATREIGDPPPPERRTKGRRFRVRADPQREAQG